MTKPTPKIKIVCGYREDQEYTVDAEEAHKAYYLFLNPEERGVFNNGVAIRGKDIQTIKPDYHASMGWNPEYDITADDMAEVRKHGLDKQIQKVQERGRKIAQEGSKDIIQRSLSDAFEQITLPDNRSESTVKLAEAKEV